MDFFGLPAADTAACLLIHSGAVKVSLDSPFTLTSGKKSPVYFDCRKLISHPAAMALVSGFFMWFMERDPDGFDVVAGGESAGIPFAAALAAASGKPMIYVRKKPRGHGTGSQIEGAAKPGDRVLLIEDLITDGGSKIGFIQALRKENLTVTHCAVVLDRDQGGAETLEKENVTLVSLAQAGNVIQNGLKLNLIPEKDAKAATAYLNGDPNWDQAG